MIDTTDDYSDLPNPPPPGFEQTLRYAPIYPIATRPLEEARAARAMLCLPREEPDDDDEGYVYDPDYGYGAEPNPANDAPPKPEAWPVLDVAGIFAKLDPVNYLLAPLDFCAGAPALIAGYGYSGKTLAAQSLGLSIAAGVQVWGCYDARRGKVLHIDYEQGARLTRQRYQRLALGMDVGPADLEDRLSLVSMPQVYLDGTLEAWLSQKFAGFDLVIVDSFRASCPTVDENDSGARLVLDVLTRCSERTGAVVLVIHHARKTGRDTGDAKMAIRGSGAIFDACGSVLVFEAEKGKPTRVSHEKARVSGRLLDDFELSTEDVEIGDDPRAGVLVTANKAPSREDAADDAKATRQVVKTERLVGQLRELFRREPEHGGADVIAAKVGRSPLDVRRALRLLIDGGEVEATGSTSDRRHRWLDRE